MNTFNDWIIADEDWVRRATEDPTVTLRFLSFSVAVSCIEASKPLPDFVDIDLQDRTLPDGILLEHLKAFQTLYREHCEVGSHGQKQDTNTDYDTLDLKLLFSVHIHGSQPLV